MIIFAARAASSQTSNSFLGFHRSYVPGLPIEASFAAEKCDSLLFWHEFLVSSVFAKNLLGPLRGIRSPVLIPIDGFSASKLRYRDVSPVLNTPLCRNPPLSYDPPRLRHVVLNAKFGGRTLDYQFKPMGKICAGSGQPLPPGSLCHSVLVERDGQLVRLDFAESSWNGMPDDAIGAWRMRVPLPPDPFSMKIDPAALMRFFEQLMEQDDTATLRTRYVAALLLLQKRRLKLEGSVYDEDHEYLQLNGVRGEGTFQVPHLELSEHELQQTQAEIRIALAAEWQT